MSDETLERRRQENQYRMEQLAARDLRRKENQDRLDLQKELALAESLDAVRACFLANLAKAENESLDLRSSRDSRRKSNEREMEARVKALKRDTREALTTLL